MSENRPLTPGHVDPIIESGDFNLSDTGLEEKMRQFQMENKPKKDPQAGIPENSPINNMKISNLHLCILHNKELKLYCETCDEPICEDCTYFGPHNSQMHRIVNLDVAYSSRVAKLGHLINSSLVAKREEQQNLIQNVNTKIEGFKSEKDRIERDIR